MTPSAVDADLTRKLADTRARATGPVDADAIAATVEAVLTSLSGDMSVADLKFYRELEQIARYIQCTKREIAEIQPRDISEEHIPLATDELDAVVDHTATATGTILDAAETLEKLGPTLPPAAAEVVAEAVTRVYEACNFQDITGQRITKVVATLKYIEHKIDALLAAFGEDMGEHKPPPAAKAHAAGGDARLMSGPQLPSAANSQDDIDAILAGFDR